jgi:DNA-binding MarR family transcriptional regulator
MVERLKVATDRRSSIIKLTAKGRRAFKKMAESHEAWIQGMLVSMPEKSKKILFESLGELKLITQTKLSTRH